MGRPPKRPGERLTKNRTFRVRGDLDELLQARAEKAGRSVSEEIEYRLNQTFEWEVINLKISEEYAEHKEFLKDDFESALRQKDFTPISMMNGGRVWAEPGFDLNDLNLAIDPQALVNEMYPGFVQLLGQALGKFAKKAKGEAKKVDKP